VYRQINLIVILALTIDMYLANLARTCGIEVV